MRIYLIAFCIILATAGQAPAQEAAHQADNDAVLAIHISNGTAGGQVDEETPVTVLFYQGDRIVKKAELTADAQGNCIVEGIPVGSDCVAVAQARHSEMAFSSVPLPLEEGKKQYDLPIQVFDVAYDRSLIRVGAHHIIVKKSGRDLQVSEYVQLINDTDKAILSDEQDDQGRPEVVRFALPDNFHDLSFSSYFHPDEIVQTETGFYDTMAIPPGSYQGVFSYYVPLETETTDITKTIVLPTESAMILVPVDGGITTEFGQPQGQMKMKDGTLTEYFTVDVKPGSTLTFHVEGVPELPTPQSPWLILNIVFAGVAVIAAIRLITRPSKS